MEQQKHIISERHSRIYFYFIPFAQESMEILDISQGITLLSFEKQLLQRVKDRNYFKS